MRSRAITASALTLTRNLAGRRFPHAEDDGTLDDLRAQVVEILGGGLWDRPWRVYELDTLSSVEIDHLVERGLMTPGFAESAGSGKGFAVYGGGEASLEINGDDHLRMLGFRAGGQLGLLWSLLNRLDDRLETVVSYAFDPQWGYLTASPRQAGSGMRAYATLQLPALMLTGRLASVALEVAGHDLGLAALWGGAGGVVQVSNVRAQGKPESETVQQIGEICRGITEKERSVRKKLLRENPIQARDQIGRALGTVKHAWSVSFHEAVNLISAVQVGVELGLVDAPGFAAEPAFGLMTRLQPAHIVVDYMDGKIGCLESPEIDERRAQMLREVFGSAGIR
jgi:protein arginine kinase